MNKGLNCVDWLQIKLKRRLLVLSKVFKSIFMETTHRMGEPKDWGGTDCNDNSIKIA